MNQVRQRLLVPILALALLVVAAALVGAGHGHRAGGGSGGSVYLNLRINGVDVGGDARVPSPKGGAAIQIPYYEHSVITAREAGSGMATGRRQHEPFVIRKRIDKATPLIYKALTRNETVDAAIRFFRPSRSGDGSTEQWYTIELKNARIISVKQGIDEHGQTMEEVSFVFHEITWTYTDGGVTHTDEWSTSK